MAKNIVFCADGTWNHPDQREAGIPSSTNVYRFYKGTSREPGQICKYDDGVGADGTPIDRLTGGAIGAGLFQKIKDGYSFVAQVFDPGDQIFLFGFSRGAYTARSLAGMIAICGLPDRNRFTGEALDDAFEAYRTRTNREPLLNRLRDNYGNNLTNIEIAMVGVWDTVGALGIPGDLFSGLNDNLYGFLNTSLHPDVKGAVHGVSIDEKRAEFAPTLWDASSVSPGSRLEQVWFAGVHCDVGGGTRRTGFRASRCAG